MPILPAGKRPPQKGGRVFLGVSWTKHRLIQSLLVAGAVLAVLLITHPQRAHLSRMRSVAVDHGGSSLGGKHDEGNHMESHALHGGGEEDADAADEGELVGGSGGHRQDAGGDEGGGGADVGAAGEGGGDNERDAGEAALEHVQGDADTEGEMRGADEKGAPALSEIMKLRSRMRRHRNDQKAKAVAHEAEAAAQIAAVEPPPMMDATPAVQQQAGSSAHTSFLGGISQAMSTTLASVTGGAAATFEAGAAGNMLVNDTTCKMPWLSMNHKMKIQFFDSHPECAYLNACEGELAVSDDPPGKIEHSSYIFRFTENIRYTHMAMVERLPNNRLVAVWQAAPMVGGANDTDLRLAVEGLDTQHIEMSISKDEEGSRWLTPRKIPLQNRASLWSPVPHIDQDGKMWLFYSESRLCKKAVPCHTCKYPPCPPITDETEICHTDPEAWVPGGDIKVTTAVGALTDNLWTRARVIYSMEEGGSIPKVISNKVAVLSSGEWLLPFWREQATSSLQHGTCPRREEDHRSGCLHGEITPCMSGTEESAGVLWSGDKGKTWKAYGEIVEKNHRTTLIEGSVAEMRNTSVIMVFRTTVGCLYSSVSRDKGKTWADPQALAVPNPNSKVHMISLKPGGELVLAFNNHRSANAYRGLKNCKACRSRMHLAISRDNGETWEHTLSMDDELSSSAVRIHYPCITQLGLEPRVVVVYSRFYLGRKLGLVSPDQGIVASAVDLSEALRRPKPVPL